MCFFCRKSLLFFFLMYTFIGFILFPWILKPQLSSAVDENLNAHLKIESLSFNPFIFKLTLEGITLNDLNTTTLFYIDSFYVNLDPSSLLYGAFHIKEIQLSKPYVYLHNSKVEGINLLKILKPSEKSNSENNTTLPRIIIDKFSLIDGKVSIKDDTREKPFEFSVENIGFSLKNIDTQEMNKQEAMLRFYSHLGDGGFIDFRSNIISLEPLKVEGSLDFEASQLYTEYRYIQEDLNLEVADGKISFHALYNFDTSDLNASQVKNLRVGVEHLRVKPKGKTKDVLNLENFSIINAQIYPFAQKVLIEDIVLNELSVKVKRNATGVIDWLEYIKVKKDNSGEEQKVQSNPWKLTVDELSLEKIKVVFEDSGVKPSVKSEINRFDLYAKDITLSGTSEIPYKFTLNANKNFHCQGEGTLIHSILDIKLHTECKNFDIVHYRPYIDQVAKSNLALYDIDLKSAVAGFVLNAEVREDMNKTTIKLYETNLYLDNIAVDKRSTKENIIRLNEIAVKEIELDTKEESVKIALLEIDSLALNTKRYKNKTFNFEKLLVSKKTKVSKKDKKSSYTFTLKNFDLNNAKIIYRDNSLNKKTKNSLSKIYFHASNISLAKKSWLDYTLRMLVNEKGELESKGTLRHTPLKQKGTFSVKNLALKDITPYLQESSYISIEDGRVSLKGEEEYEVSSHKPDLRVRSRFELNSLFVNNARDASSLLSVNNLKTDSFTLELSPNRFYINELNVNSFYVNAFIDENKTLNFSKLVKENNETEELEDKKNESAPFPVKILKVNVALGSAKFADNSIPIHFNTHIHDLNGVLYSLSNIENDTTYVDIVGEVDKYGSTLLKGSFDGSDPLAYTDLVFSFKNLDMHSLSGYSASFAGHEIDDGKLYLDLGYEILDSQLLGSNNIIIKKIVLGKEIEDENITVLPLGFVFGLLEDSDGIVDIEMPVEGDINNPDFKYGRVLFNTFTGLIAKAITSPFRFLGEVMGFDAAAIEFVSFEPGRVIISPPEREKLDQVYKIMLKKPKISLSITGSYDEVLDTKAMKTDKLIDLVMQKSGITNRENHKSAMSISLLEDIYEDMRDDDYLDELEERLEDEKSTVSFDRRYYNAVIAHCIEIQKVSKQELLMLAEKRADAMVIYLVQEKKLLSSRVEKLPEVSSSGESEKMVQVHMQIEVK